MGTEKIHLTIVSDDFGMCNAVNEGIVKAFTDGLLTDTNIMAPCSHFEEAVLLGKEYKIPIGVHTTFSSSWDISQCKPLTPLLSMVTQEGNFKPTVQEAWSGANFEEAVIELKAQLKLIEDAGIVPTHHCEHMGCDKEGQAVRVCAEVFKENRIPNRGVSPEYLETEIARYQFLSSISLSSSSPDFATKKEWLKKKLFALTPGYHHMMTHVALDLPDLKELCSVNHPSYLWARDYRITDLAIMLDPEVKSWIEGLGIELTPINKVPVLFA